MRYADWCELILRLVIQHGAGSSQYGGAQIADELGFVLGDIPSASPQGQAIMAAVADLQQLGLVESASWWSVTPTEVAERYQRDSLRWEWPVLREAWLDADHDAYLARLVELGVQEHEAFAESRFVRTTAVFDALGWQWDVDRDLTILKALSDWRFVELQRPQGDSEARARLAGVLRSTDEVGIALAEAREHLAARRLRAAGSSAAVVLERHLRSLVPRPPGARRGRPPGLEDYGRAASRAGLIDDATERLIRILAELRIRFVHAGDAEPTIEDTEKLIGGVDTVLRRSPVPARPGATNRRPGTVVRFVFVALVLVVIVLALGIAFDLEPVRTLLAPPR
jgi:hypothetical protein